MSSHTEGNFKKDFRSGRNIPGSVAIAAGLVALAVSAMPGLAQAIVVNSATESDLFVCTLREAINFHNHAGCYNPPPFGTCNNQGNTDTIDFAPNITNVFLASPLPAITPPNCGGGRTLSIFPTLNRVTLHGAYFEIDKGAGLEMYNINTTFGILDFQEDVSPFFINGGTLKIRIGDFSNNSSTPPEFGGVIYNKGGYLTIGGAGATGDISLHDSRATEAGGVIYNAGGNVSIGTLAPKHAIVLQNNFSPTGGAIYSRGGTLTIESTSFAGNKADDNAAGGGLFVSNTGLTIRRSTFTGNEAGQPGTGDTGEGGAVLLASKLPAAISSSTFAQNNSGAGGAIFYQGNTNANPLKITNCTFYDAPSLDTRDDLYVSSGTAQVTFSTSVNGGFQTINSGKINLRNTIAAAESICQGNPASYIDNGHNIQFSTAPNCPATIPNVDPSLDPDGLQSNGGPTQTVAIEAGSPALNAIGVRNCTTLDGVRVLSDQRLFPRPAKGLNRCDIGAYEGVHNPAP